MNGTCRIGGKPQRTVEFGFALSDLKEPSPQHFLYEPEAQASESVFVMPKRFTRLRFGLVKN